MELGVQAADLESIGIPPGSSGELGMDDASDVGRDLVTRIWVTKGARFLAHRRLSTIHAWSTAAVAILSAYLLIASLIVSSTAVPLSEHQRAQLNLVTTGMALVVLVLSLLEGSRNYLLRAERLHSCAVELGAIEQRVRLAQEISDHAGRLKVIATLSEDYHNALVRCGENHLPVDNSRFRCDHPKDFPCSKWTAFKARSNYMWYSRGPFALAIVVPPIALALVWLYWKAPLPAPADLHQPPVMTPQNRSNSPTAYPCYGRGQSGVPEYDAILVVA